MKGGNTRSKATEQAHRDLLAGLTPAHRKIYLRSEEKRRLTVAKAEAERRAVLAQTAMARDEAVQTISAIARGMVPSDGKTRLLACKLLSTMEGWEAPKKHELSGPGGTPISVSNVTREQAAEALRDAAARDPALAAELARLGGGGG